MPKGGASSLTPVHAGIQEDMDAFLKAFLKLESSRYAVYKELFVSRGMVQLLNGRSNSAEIIEFNECILVHCLTYMEDFVCSSSSVRRHFNEKLFGLYSLYTFFHLQQGNHVVKVRMDPDAARNFHRISDLVFKDEVHDAYMICLKLVENKAFKHVAFIPMHDPANFKRFHSDGKVSGVSVQVNRNDPLGRVKMMVESDDFQKIFGIHSEYTELKNEVKITEFPLTDLKEKVEKLLVKHSKEVEADSGVNEVISTDYSMEQLNARGMRRSKLKDQANTADLALSRSRRHRGTAALPLHFNEFGFVEDFMDEMEEPKEPPKKLKKRGPKKRKDRVPK